MVSSVAKGSIREVLYQVFLFQLFFDDLRKDIQNSNNGVKVYDTEIASPSFADDQSHIFK